MGVRDHDIFLPKSRSDPKQKILKCKTGRGWGANVVSLLTGLLYVQSLVNNNIILSYRPLLYGLHIQEDFKTLRSYAFNSKDYQVTPGSPWNYAIKLSEDDVDKDLVVVETGIKKGVSPFSTNGAPVMIKAKVGWVDDGLHVLSVWGRRSNEG
ncbi:hypothetical protein [Nitrosopumilus sp. Nsub]|uniref:hypothetical protein n=1 Tax=Nitrosopumilus sp. Nsub TaxID=1776294 RepID=UPI0012E36CA5|nr:hypothetical protein [Nitrosopumilus sp. Nsub]